MIIEEALDRHPAVETAAAVGLPDTYAGELPMVFVQLAPGAERHGGGTARILPPEIPERAAVPVQVAPIPVMPLTGVGKIYKPALRLEAAQRAFEAAIAPLRAEGTTAAVTVRDDRDPRHAGGGAGHAPAGASQEAVVQPVRRVAGRLPDPPRRRVPLMQASDADVRRGSS